MQFSGWYSGTAGRAKSHRHQSSMDSVLHSFDLDVIMELLSGLALSEPITGASLVNNIRLLPVMTLRIRPVLKAESPGDILWFPFNVDTKEQWNW